MTYANYVCHRCAAPPESEVQDSMELLLKGGTRLEIVNKFCYLGDMIGAAGGTENAARALSVVVGKSLMSLLQY